MYTQPLAQATLISLINIGMIVYLIWRYPIRNSIRLLQNIVQEIVLMIVNGCMVTLAIFDAAKIGSTQSREKIGDVIMYCSIVFSWLGLVFLLISAVFNLIIHCRDRRYKKERAVFLMQRANLRKPREPLSQKLQQSQKEELKDSSVLVHLNLNQSSSSPPVPRINIPADLSRDLTHEPIFRRATFSNLILNKPANSLATDNKVIEGRARQHARSIYFKNQKGISVVDSVVDLTPENEPVKVKQKKGSEKAKNETTAQLDGNEEKGKSNKKRIRHRKNKSNTEVQGEKDMKAKNGGRH